MTHYQHRLAALAALAVLLCAAALPSMAASSAASSASDSIGTSVGSISGSIQKSSDSSSTTKVADGDYKIIDMATVDERPGMVRVKLQAVLDRGADGEFFLYLPHDVASQSGLAQGGIVTARQRPYGVEFAQGQAKQAFFLVLSDDWYRELQTTAVVL